MRRMPTHNRQRHCEGHPATSKPNTRQILWKVGGGQSQRAANTPSNQALVDRAKGDNTGTIAQLIAAMARRPSGTLMTTHNAVTQLHNWAGQILLASLIQLRNH